MPFSKGKIFKNHLQAFGHWIRVRVRAYLRVPDLHAPYLSCTWITATEKHFGLKSAVEVHRTIHQCQWSKASFHGICHRRASEKFQVRVCVTSTL